MSALKEFVVWIRGKQDVDKAAKQAGDATESFAQKATGAIKGLMAFAGAAALGAFFKKAVTEALEGEAGIQRLGIAVENAGAKYVDMEPAISGVVDELSTLTTFTDDEVRAALGNMVTMTGDVQKSLGAMGVVADLAAAKQIPLEQASQAVAAAMNGNTKALEKMVGPMKAGADVIGVLGDRVGGTAKQMGDTLPGAIARATNQVGEIMEAIGNAIIGTDEFQTSGSGLVTVLADMASWIEENADQAQPLITALFDIGRNIYEAVVPAFEVLAPIAKFALFSIATSLETVSLAVRAFAGAFQGSIGIVAEALGWIATKGGGILRKFGVDVSEDAGASLKTWGAKMIANAEDSLSRTGTAIGKHVKDTIATVTGGEQAHTRVVQQESGKRVTAFEVAGDRITKTQKKAAEEATKAAQKQWEQLGKDLDKTITAIEKSLGQLDTDATKAGDALLEALGPILRTSIEGSAQALTRLWDEAQLDPRVMADYARYQGALNLLRSSADALATAQQASVDAEHGLPTADSLTRLDEAIAGLREQARLLRTQIGDSEQVRTLEQRAAELTEKRTGLEEQLNRKKDEGTKKTKEQTDAALALIGRVEGIARATLDVLSATELVNDETAAYLTSIINIGTSIAKITAGDLTAIPGLLGGISNVISRLMNGDEVRKRLLSDNSRQLERLRLEGIAGLNMSGSTLANLRDALSSAVPQLRQGSSSFNFIPNMEVLLRALGQSGVTLGQLEEFAKGTGIALRDSKGNFNFDAVRQLFEALNGLSSAVGTSPDAQLSALKDRLRVTGATDEDTARALAAFLRDRSPIAEGLSVTDPGAAYQRLLDVLSRLDTGRVELRELGGLSRDQFRSVVLELLGLTRAQATRNGAAGLLNFPDATSPVPSGVVSAVLQASTVGTLTTDAVAAALPAMTDMAGGLTDLSALVASGVDVARAQLAQMTRSTELQATTAAATNQAAAVLALALTELQALNRQLVPGVADVTDRLIAQQRVIQQAAAAPPPTF